MRLHGWTTFISFCVPKFSIKSSNKFQRGIIVIMALLTGGNMLRIIAISFIFQLLNSHLAFGCWSKSSHNSAPHSNNENLNPKTSEELRQAIVDSQPGNTIELLPIVYEGDFQLSGSKNVTIKGTSKKDVSTTIVSSGTAFSISGSNWRIESLKIQRAQIGVYINGHKNLVSAISMVSVGKGVIITGNENVIKSSSIESTDLGLSITGTRNQIESCSLLKPSSSSAIKLVGNQNIFSATSISWARNGFNVNRETSTRPTCINIIGNDNSFSTSSIACVDEGIIIDGDNNIISRSAIRSEAIGINVVKGHGNKIESSSIVLSDPSLIISTGSSGGSLLVNSFTGKVNIFGNGYTITSNSATGGANIEGCNNILSKNSMKDATIKTECNQINNTNYFG